ncbi:MAG: hypothetical protein RLZZ126_1201 [Pseudomonadota bacterium]|jgi:exodeoxyribonuclease VII large subunit
MLDLQTRANTGRTWQVGALCRAIADALQARFSTVAVQGELLGFTRASSGHCYFTLKDAHGQMRCAMFRRAALGLTFDPRDGDRVELRARVDVYDARGDLQLIADSMRPVGQGALMEQFLRVKARLEAEGLFSPERKRPVPALPRGIGVVTSLQAAALADVLSALQRRALHVPVIVSAASVQGENSPVELSKALQNLYLLNESEERKIPNISQINIDVILLVRGGGSPDDLAAFNDEQLARVIAASPVPVISGVGHETDFSIADFVADLRAPTPTAAAELAATARSDWQQRLQVLADQLHRGAHRLLDRRQQRLDEATARLLRPSQAVQLRRLRLKHLVDRLSAAIGQGQVSKQKQWQRDADRFAAAWPLALRRRREQLERLALRMEGANPQRVLSRGYAWVSRPDGSVVPRAADLVAGDGIRVRFADGDVGARVE